MIKPVQPNSFYRSFFEYSMDAVFLTAPDGETFAANPAACKLFGRTEEDICKVGRSGIVDSTSPQLISFLAERANTGKAKAELVLIRADSTKFPGEVSSNQFTDENGNLRTITIIRDLTEQKKAELKLAESDTLFRIALSNSPIVVFEQDLNLRYLWIYNPKLGYSVQQVIGKSDAEILDPSCVPAHETLKYKVINTGLPARQEIAVAAPGATLEYFDLYIEPRYDQDGKIIGIICAGSDISERKIAEKVALQNEANFRAVLDNSPYLTWLKDTNGNYITINKTFANYLRLEDERQVIGKTDFDFHPKELAEKYRADDAEVIASRQQKYVEESAFDGKNYHWVESFKTPVIDAEGDVLGTVGFARDISDRKRIETELRISSIAFESQESMMITDTAGVILRVNHAFTLSTGYSAEEVLGLKPSILKSGHHDANFYRAMWEVIKQTGAWQGEIWDRRKNGEVYPKWLTISAVKDAAGIVTHYVGSHIDITERKQAEEKIKYLAYFDHLTNLPNRRLLLDRLQQALASSARSERKGALFFIDLDNFKTLNDTLGHSIGDMLLHQVGQRLESCVRDGDTVARLGGDEFVVLLENLSKEEMEAATQAEGIAEKILVTLSQPYSLESHELHNTPSIGITLFSRQQQTSEELFKQADMAMYQAKKAGRNTLRFFDPKMQESLNARTTIEAELRNAIEKNQFQLYYQVQVDGSRRPVGAEALIRWKHPERGLVPPIEFIPLAEETGLILLIGQWVLETACRQLALWSKQKGKEHLTVAVNVSAHQFHQVDFVDRVLEVLERTGAKPHQLLLEVTESLLLGNIDDVITKMKVLKTWGVGFSLDDFGTGYSSLSYLSRLPLNELKIDRSFVMEIETNDNAVAISTATVGLAHSLSLKVVAEGIETEGQFYILSSVHHCDCLQGYFFGKPVPIEQFEENLCRFKQCG